MQSFKINNACEAATGAAHACNKYLQVSRGLPAAILPMKNRYCSCRLTRSWPLAGHGDLGQDGAGRPAAEGDPLGAGGELRAGPPARAADPGGQVSRGLQPQSLWIIPTAAVSYNTCSASAHKLTAAIPMENPYCSCEL